MKERKRYNIEVTYSDDGTIDNIDIQGKNRLSDIMELNEAIFNNIKFQILANTDFYETKDVLHSKHLLDKTTQICNNKMLRKHLISLFLTSYNDYDEKDLDKMNFKITIFKKDDDSIDYYAKQISNAEDVKNLFSIFKDIISQPFINYNPNVENECIEYSTSLNYFQKMHIMLMEWGSLLKEIKFEDESLARQMAMEFSRNFKTVIYDVLDITPKEEN